MCAGEADGASDILARDNIESGQQGALARVILAGNQQEAALRYIERSVLKSAKVVDSNLDEARHE
ncbi:hypothetical protein Val02_66880 [Virgisporangium aliadipatigenens]|uniref:Uncharacterized protein n=1 Tax=Virgisporangium aliadipatigenens TaxID=741659 RepID=A0A8J3YSG0_9ACTN|nr:hypothetical protein Val02_66880 [Virgisporangium aliadipatigenens]